MRRMAITGLLVVGAAAAAWSAQPAPAPAPEAAPPAGVQPQSYGVGFVLGEEVRAELAADGVGADLDLVSRGFREGAEQQPPLFARQDMEGILQAVHAEMEQRMVERLLAESPEFKKLHDANLARSRAFADLFGRQEGVVTEPDGIQYKVLRPGSGPSPGLNDTVTVRADVRTLGGRVLQDNEVKTFRVNTVVPGASRVLQMMSVGAKWQVAVPPQLAHGAAGRLPDIGPNETLVAIVELIEIKEG